MLQYSIINDECTEWEIECMYVYNPFGQEPEDFNRDTAGFRVGRRIRTIRIKGGISRRVLGVKVGLNANRVQQYESGERRP